MSNPLAASSTSAGQTAGSTPLRIGQAELVVHELEAMARFYQGVIGLQRLKSEADSITLGTAAAPLITLRHDAGARTRLPSEAGLFHTAFLLPHRDDLGRWLVHAANSGVQLTGAADHLVSEALYLDDPEGNGIEIYADRAPAQWTWRDGKVAMDNQRLDLAALAQATGQWNDAPDVTTIGHMHLQVGDLGQATDFYSAIAGLEVTCFYPGAVFLASGGYHHHVAVNIWNSRGAGAPDRPVTGLASFEFLTDDPTLAETAATRANKAGLPVSREQNALGLTDPWGIQTRMRYAPAIRS